MFQNGGRSREQIELQSNVDVSNNQTKNKTKKERIALNLFIDIVSFHEQITSETL